METCIKTVFNALKLYINTSIYACEGGFRALSKIYYSCQLANYYVQIVKC